MQMFALGERWEVGPQLREDISQENWEDNLAMFTGKQMFTGINRPADVSGIQQAVYTECLLQTFHCLQKWISMK